MWPILKHLGRAVRHVFPLDYRPLACPACGKPEGLIPWPVAGKQEPAWRCENCGVTFREEK